MKPEVKVTADRLHAAETTQTPLPWSYGNGAIWSDCNGDGNSPTEVASYVSQADGELIVAAVTTWKAEKLKSAKPLPGRAEELARRVERYPSLPVCLNDVAEFLRAQSAELLALRADKRRLDWLECHALWNDWNGTARIAFAIPTVKYCTLREATDAALNSPTQKSPAK